MSDYITQLLDQSLGSDGAPWELIANRDNLVYATKNRLIKIAKHPDGPPRLLNGIKMAQLAASVGIPVALPTRSNLIQTQAGLASLWPYIHAQTIHPASLAGDHAFALGASLARLSTLTPDAPREWNPFRRAPHRILTSKYPANLTSRTANLIEQTKQHIKTLGMTSLLLAHGDASASNLLATSDTTIKIIDFDATGYFPPGWDLASLYSHLVTSHNNPQGFAQVLEGWESQNGKKHLSWQHLSIVKAMTATSFLLTLEPTEQRIQALSIRLNAINSWLQTGIAPKHLPGIEWASD